MCQYCGRMLDDKLIGSLQEELGAGGADASPSGGSGLGIASSGLINSLQASVAGLIFERGGQIDPLVALTQADHFAFNTTQDGETASAVGQWMQNEQLERTAELLPASELQSDGGGAGEFWTFLSVTSIDDWLS